MENIRVSDIMTRGHIISDIKDNILDCAKKMVRKKVSGLVITNKKKLAGFISGQDILWALIKNPKADLSKIKAIDISPKRIITIKSSASLKEALKKIKTSKFYRLPVVDNGDVVGMVTVKDILSFYPEAYSELRELDFIREEKEKMERIKKEHGKFSPVTEDGICEECGERGILYRTNGMLMCASCSSSI